MLLRLLTIFGLCFCLSSTGHTATYKYAGNNPMAKMMLDLMEVMGFIYRVPDSAGGGYGGSGMSGWNPLGMYSGLSNPMLMYQGAGLASQAPGMFPSMGGWNGQPFAMPGNNLDTHGKQIQLSVNELQQLLESQSAQPRTAPVPDGQFLNRPKALAAVTPAVSEGSAPVSPTARPEGKRGGGVEIPTLDQFEGVWLGTRDDFLRISGNEFLWTAADGSTLNGSFYMDGGMMVVQTQQSPSPVRYVVNFSEHSFAAVNQAGHRYEFFRPLSSR